MSRVREHEARFRTRILISLLATSLLVGPYADATPQHQTRTKDLRAETAVGSRTVLVEGRGMVLKVEPGQGDRAIVEASVEYWSDDEGWMQSMEAEYDVQVSERNDRVKFDFTGPPKGETEGFWQWLFGGSDYSWSLDVLLTLPAGTSLEVENAYGSVSVDGLRGDVAVASSSGEVTLWDVGSVSVENSYAPVRIERASGRVVVASSSAAVSIEAVTGGVEARSSYAEMRIVDVEGDVDADMSSGELEIRDVRGDVRSRNSYSRAMVADVTGDLDHETSSGEVEIRDVDGTVRATNSYGAMSLASTGAADLGNSSGSVSAMDVTGPLTITNSYAPVTVADVDGDVRIDSSSAGVEVRNVQGGVEVKTSYDGVEIEGVGGPVRVRNSSGRVKVTGFRGDALSAEHTLETSYAGIEVVWPAGTDVGIDARCTYGSMVSEIGGAVEQSSSGARHTLRREGTGGAHLRLVTSSGSINILER